VASHDSQRPSANDNPSNVFLLWPLNRKFRDHVRHFQAFGIDIILRQAERAQPYRTPQARARCHAGVGYRLSSERPFQVMSGTLAPVNPPRPRCFLLRYRI